jgi:hypothetical protein
LDVARVSGAIYDGFCDISVGDSKGRGAVREGKRAKLL